MIRSIFALLSLTILGCEKSGDPTIRLGRQIYVTNCRPCHEPGRGTVGPSGATLSRSPFVLGSEQELVRIVLHGLRAPVEVDGNAYTLDMPALGHALSDKNIAAVLTYSRQAWENDASAVSEEAVASIRQATVGRAERWTPAELRRLSENRESR